MNAERREADKIGRQISRRLPKLLTGSPRFWGMWFGSPHDGFWTLLRCEVNQSLLRLYFDEGEILSIWSPRGLAMNESSFRISDADRVRWEWFYYGRPKIASNLYFEEFVRSSGGIVATTNRGWHDVDSSPDPSEAAVEIL